MEVVCLNQDGGAFTLLRFFVRFLICMHFLLYFGDI